MSAGDWLYSILVPSACISIWCLMWCCFVRIRTVPAQPMPAARRKEFQYLPLTAPRAQASTRLPTITEDEDEEDKTPPTPNNSPEAARLLPGLHFIRTNSIN